MQLLTVKFGLVSLSVFNILLGVRLTRHKSVVNMYSASAKFLNVSFSIRIYHCIFYKILLKLGRASLEVYIVNSSMVLCVCSLYVYTRSVSSVSSLLCMFFICIYTFCLVCVFALVYVLYMYMNVLSCLCLCCSVWYMVCMYMYICICLYICIILSVM